MALKSVFLDVGDTLISERQARAEIYARAARDFGLQVDAARMAELMRDARAGLPREIDGTFRYSDAWFEAFIERIFGAGLGLAREHLPGLTRGLFERFSDPATFHVYPGAFELLERLREQGLTVGIVSNWSARLTILLERLGIAEQVDFVLSSAVVGCEKPEPGIFERALSLCSAAPEEALHAGDHPEHDVLAARRVGIDGVLVDHAGRFARRDLPRVTSLGELLRWIESLMA